MVDCGQCGESLDNLAYSCNYCGQSNCSEHRLPEKHDCIALHLTQPPESSKAEADAYLARPRDFRGDETFVDRVEAFREQHLPSSEAGSEENEEALREVLEEADTEASDAKVDAVVENVQNELKEPAEKPYSVFESKYTVGTQPDPGFASSPDVAPDGSIATPEMGAEPPSEPSRKRRGVFGIPIEIIIVCAVLGLMAAIVFLL